MGSPPVPRHEPHQDFQTLEMLPIGRPEEYEAVIPGDEIDPHFDLMYFFEVMDNAGNGKIDPNLAKEIAYIVVKTGEVKASKLS